MYKQQQAILIIIGIAMVAGLYFLGVRQDPNPAATGATAANSSQQAAAQDFDFEKVISNVKHRMDSLQSDSIQHIEAQVAAAKADTSQYITELDALIKQWEKIGYVQIGAYYRKKMAQLDSTKKNWEQAGDALLFSATQIAADSLVGSFLLQNATAAFQNVLAIDTSDLEAKVKLASTYISNSPSNQVMQGVFLLREVIAVDSTHLSANLLLGRMSVMSGQLDKAVQRFSTIVRNDSTNSEALYYLGETYLALKDKQKAISTFEECKKWVKNPSFTKKLDSIIVKIK